MLDYLVGVHGMLAYVDDTNGYVGAMVAHALKVGDQIRPDKSGLDGAGAVTNANNVVIAEKGFETINHLLQRLDVVSGGEIIVEISHLGQGDDEDGYMPFKFPWSVTFSYGITMAEDRSAEINLRNMRYPYKFTQNLNISGNIGISDNWRINFTSGYNFEYKKLTTTTLNISRDLHCFEMSCGIVLAPYTSFNFSFRATSQMLADALKIDKRSSQSSNVQWYND